LIRAAREGKKKFGFGTMDIGSPWNEDGNGNGSSPAQDGVKEHEEEMEMAASVRLLTRFRHMAGTQLDDLVVSPPLLFYVTYADTQAKCDDALEAVQSLSQATSGQVDLPSLRNALGSSLKQFNDSATRAIKRLYAGPKREKGMYHGSDSDDSDGGVIEDLDDSTATGPNETVFLVYL
jgi:hypothetical protein